MAFGVAAFAGMAHATAVSQIEQTKIQALATQIQAALSRVGCSATTEQEIVAVEDVITASGATPQEAQAALALAHSFQGLCGEDSAALGAVSHTIFVAVSRSDPAGAPIGSLGFGGPTGAPPIYVGAEPLSTNYQ